jgi:hypothetical protein
MFHKLMYVALGGVAVIVVKGLGGGTKPIAKHVYRGIARVNRGIDRLTAEFREDLEDARQEVEREAAMHHAQHA